MPLFRKKPVVIEATQWFKNGDHPADNATEMFDYPDGQRPRVIREGEVVRYFRRPDVPGEMPCFRCGVQMHDHGWIDTLEGGHTVCIGDWIITGVQGERYPCKPEIFAATYEEATLEDEPLDAQLVLALLYEHEINCGVSSFWDEGYRAWIGDDRNGRLAEQDFHPNPKYGRPIDQIGNWLWEAAVSRYPEIEKPRDVPTIAAE